MQQGHGEMVESSIREEGCHEGVTGRYGLVRPEAGTQCGTSVISF